MPTTYTTKHCAGHIVTTLDQSQLGGVSRRAPRLESSRSMQRKEALVVCPPLPNIYADRLDLFAIMVAWPKNPFAGEHLVNETHRITCWPKRNLQTNRSTRHAQDWANRALWRPQRGASRQKTSWWYTCFTLQSVSLQYTCAKITLLVSLPPEFTPVTPKSWLSWWQYQPLQCGPKCNNDTNRSAFSPESRITNIQVKNRWTRHQSVSLHTTHCGDHIVTTLFQSQLGGIHRRAPRLKCLRFIRKLRQSFHVQHIRGSPGHDRYHSSARQSHSTAVPQSKMTQVESRTHQKRKNTPIRNENRSTGHANMFTNKLLAKHIVGKANLVAYTLTIQRWNLHFNAHQRRSSPFHKNVRGSCEQTSLRSQRLDIHSTAVSKSTTEVD